MAAVLDVLRDLYAQQDVAGFAERVVAALPRLIATDIASFNEVDPATGHYRTVVAPVGADRFPGSEDVFARHVREHPYITHIRRFEDGRAHALSEFVLASHFRGTAIYNEYYRRIGTEHQLAVALPGASPWIRGVALSRRRREYSARERHLLTTLGPHLVQAYRTAEALEQAHGGHLDKAAAADGGDPSTGPGSAEVLLLSPAGRLQFATPRARRWLVAYFGVSADRDGRVPAVLADWMRSRRRAPDDPAGMPAPRVPLVVSRNGGALEIRSVECSPAALVVRERRAPAAGTLAALGLSLRETEVLGWVVEGKTNGEIGAILGTRPRTVAKHLERIFRKLGVETRTAAAATVLGRPRP
jgi:DNA-binding CsgD family transcriptional regulator